MAGLLTTPLVAVNFNQAPLTGTHFTGALPSAGIDAAGTGTAFGTAWGSNNVLLVPNTSGNTMLWYYNGSTGAAGIAQVLVGEVVAGSLITAATAKTIAVSESGWLGPFSPATYNIKNTSLVHSGIAGSPTIASWPTAAIGCYAVAFTTTTYLSVRAYTFSSIQP
jgi:hypothetical protein